MTFHQHRMMHEIRLDEPCSKPIRFTHSARIITAGNLSCFVLHVLSQVFPATLPASSGNHFTVQYVIAPHG